MHEALAIYGSGAAVLMEKEGSSARLDARQPTDMQARGYLFAATGNPLSNGVPSQLTEAVRDILSGRGDGPDARALVVRVTGPSGKSYLAAAPLRPHAPPPFPIRPFPPPSAFWLQAVITFFVSGAVCYGLSWRMTAPVRRLRAATQRLASGDLTSRVEVGAGQAGHELHDLGRDFNRMAERMERLVLAHKQLMRDVSHELRSPLARLNVALAISRKDSAASAAPALDRIEQEGERLNQLIGELLTLSKLEGGMTAGTDSFELRELVQEVVQDAEFEACAADRHVALAPAPALPFIGDREQLRRALENVVRNAIRYTASGTNVEVTLQQTAAGEAVLRVRDFGPGVPEEHLPDIFRPFYRVAEARERQTGGTGIGLAISEKTVSLHGGSIVARNAEEGGLEVEITLPLAVPTSAG